MQRGCALPATTCLDEASGSHCSRQVQRATVGPMTAAHVNARSQSARGVARTHGYPPRKHEVSEQKYMDRHGLLQVVQSAMRLTVSNQPEDPFSYMAQLLLAVAAERRSRSLGNQEQKEDAKPRLSEEQSNEADPLHWRKAPSMSRWSCSASEVQTDGSFETPSEVRSKALVKAAAAESFEQILSQAAESLAAKEATGLFGACGRGNCSEAPSSAPQTHRDAGFSRQPVPWLVCGPAFKGLGIAGPSSGTSARVPPAARPTSAGHFRSSDRPRPTASSVAASTISALSVGQTVEEASDYGGSLCQRQATGAAARHFLEETLAVGHAVESEAKMERYSLGGSRTMQDCDDTVTEYSLHGGAVLPRPTARAIANQSLEEILNFDCIHPPANAVTAPVEAAAWAARCQLGRLVREAAQTQRSCKVAEGIA
mmetsp:Transcript_133412/g.371959  ORF Transcript_133412/g.371959 Transcript_133412/m.371959 type:complete len:427 (+) Transcript_133412:195-1475(+)